MHLQVGTKILQRLLKNLFEPSIVTKWTKDAVRKWHCGSKFARNALNGFFRKKAFRYRAAQNGIQLLPFARRRNTFGLTLLLHFDGIGNRAVD